MSGGAYYGESSSSSRYFVCHVGAVAAAGTIAATFVCPLDVIKTRLQVHGLPPGHQGSIIITSLRNITEAEGLRGLYRGLSPTIIALLPTWAVYFTVYERLKGMLHKNGNHTEIEGKHVFRKCQSYAIGILIGFYLML